MLDRTPVPASPASEALRSNLHDSALTLKKKRSWFDSVRDGAHKMALGAKAAVDLFRSDQSSKAEQCVTNW